jgi:DNA helicase IV
MDSFIPTMRASDYAMIRVDIKTRDDLKSLMHQLKEKSMRRLLIKLIKFYRTENRL